MDMTTTAELAGIPQFSLPQQQQSISSQPPPSSATPMGPLQGMATTSTTTTTTTTAGSPIEISPLNNDRSSNAPPLPPTMGALPTVPLPQRRQQQQQQQHRHHAAEATPRTIDPSMEPVISVTQRLLGLRGSPPGTLASLAEHEIKMLCRLAKPLLLQQPMLLELEAPIKICGDVHGQYTDLLRLLEYGGFPPQANYLFLGDYVDRGKQSIETICLLLAYKIQYTQNFFILRGNHESAGINRIYGFYDECKRRYSIKLWKVFSDVFNCLPVAATINDKILCMHGGLSPELSSLEQIEQLERPCDVPDRGLLCDLLWSDPDPNVSGWAENDRGVSFVFGKNVVERFLDDMGLDLIVRAHQVMEDGYEFFAGRKLVTLFSAPNYCGEFDNAGGMITIDEELLCSFQILKPSSKSTRLRKNNNNSNGTAAARQPLAMDARHPQGIVQQQHPQQQQ